MFSSVSSKFDSLELRPPTPPREISKAIDDAISFLDDSNEIERLTKDPRPGHQPENIDPCFSPSSSQDSAVLTNPTKRVGFSHHPLYYKLPLLGESTSPSSLLYKRSPSQKNAKPLKSILKLSNAPPPTPEDLDAKLHCFSPDVPGSFGKMLQSALQHLAGPSRSSRLDAYLALNGSLKAHEDLPDHQEMAQKMRLIMQFLSRDIAWKNESGLLDMQIITQALRLTMAIMSSSKLSDALDDDFRVFIVDRSISILEQPEMPKPLVKMHMYLLCQQRFRSSIMTPGRTERIVVALQTIEDRCSGNIVVSTRLAIYRRLVEQAPGLMLNKMREWLEHVFHGMLSSIKDVRVRAIDGCTQAGITFGLQPHAGKILHAIFEEEVEEGQNYGDYYSLRLCQMMSDKETWPYVPQIWSAVILFFRSQRKPLDKWPRFKSWLLIIQKCLNSSDLTTKYHATLAWNKLVFAVMPDSTTTKSMMGMLTLPICNNLDKRGADKFSKQVRQFGLDSYYNLLHYGLRPGLTNQEVDEAWDSFIDPVVDKMVRSNGKGRFLACQVLNGLLSGNSGGWNVNAALDLTPIRPEELPRLEPKWVRSRLARIQKLIEPAIVAGVDQSSASNAAVDATWRSLMQSIADAGSQEVKTTMELKEAIALLVGFFRSLWTHCLRMPGEANSHSWLARYVSLLDTMLVVLGAAPFAEDILATTKEDSIEVAPTPSHRSSKHQHTPQSPFVILFRKFYMPPPATVADDDYESLLSTVLKRFLSCKSTPAARLELLSRSLSYWNNSSHNASALVSIQTWRAIAATTINDMKSEVDRSNKQDSQDLGHVLRHGIDILMYGLGVGDDSRALSAAIELYDNLFDAAKTRAGDGGVTLAVMEPFAKALEAAFSATVSTKLLLTTHMLRKKVWPRTRQSLDQARKFLWGIGAINLKPAMFDPFEHVYSLVEDLARTTYNGIYPSQPHDFEIIHDFFKATLEFLEASPLSLLVAAIRKMQSGFVVWVEDSARKTATNDNVSNMVQEVWSRLIRLMQSHPSKDSTLLKVLEPVLVAGFASPHRVVVNEAITFWNETFGNEQSLEFPPKLENVLRARFADADISLPTFPNSNGERIPASLPAFFDSQDGVQTEAQGLKNSGITRRDMLNVNATWRSTAKTSPGPVRNSLSSPARGPSRLSKSSTPKARLRHDDSQIQFAPVDSSPLPPADESQFITEHQKEVKARQQQNAQFFPDFSSSPMAQSTALPRQISKRLDFVSATEQNNEDEAFGTPTDLPNANGLVSDDMPSSPTPSSTKDASQSAMHLDDDEEDNDAPQDPPSSPPQASDKVDRQMEEPWMVQGEVNPQNPTTSVMDHADSHHPDALEQTTEMEPGDVFDGGIGPEPEKDDLGSAPECPSESQMPTLQLQLEAEAAQQANIAATSLQQEHEDEAQQIGSSQQQDAEKRQDDRSDESVLHSSNGDATTVPELDEVTRVEDSFIESVVPNTEVDTQSNADSQQSPNASKKRKRRSGTKFTTRKRKQQSPFYQRVWSTFVGGVQEDDDDMEEDIVVASSQTASSPVRGEAHQEPSLPAIAADTDREPANKPIGIVKEEQLVMHPPPKRGPGRPGRSETPTSSQSKAVPPRSLKRRASVLSNASMAESLVSTSFVKDTQAPTKAKKLRGAQAASNGEASQISQDTTRAGQVIRRKATAVVIGSPGCEDIDSRLDHPVLPANQPSAEVREDESTQIATPEKQLAGEQAATLNDRPILTPRSILGRLKDALSDFRGLILGPQEEREFDDVLFALRREAHEAGRRGRE